MASGRMPGGVLAYQRAAFGHLPCHRGVLRGIHGVQSVGEDGQGATSGIQGDAMGNGVDAPGEAAHYGDAVLRQVLGQLAGHLPSVGRSLARPNYSHGAPVLRQEFALDVQHRRVVVHLPEQAGIGGVSDCDGVYAQLLKAFPLGVRGYGRPAGDDGPHGALVQAGGGQIGGSGAPSRLKIAKVALQYGEPGPADGGYAVEGHPVLGLVCACSHNHTLG